MFSKDQIPDSVEVTQWTPKTPEHHPRRSRWVYAILRVQDREGTYVRVEVARPDRVTREEESDWMLRVKLGRYTYRLYRTSYHDEPIPALDLIRDVAEGETLAEEIPEEGERWRDARLNTVPVEEVSGHLQS